jgi:16S rRNA C967 or C1407 C5-methylase (RsmB/RsmF family)/NOL1/NOP2/fmu family ribosome biogenesis protein
LLKSFKILFPEKFTERLARQNYLDSVGLKKALEEPSPVSVRVNKLKFDAVPSEADPVSWCSDGFYLKERPSFTLDPLFHAGCYYPQEASGMFLEEIFRQTADKSHNLKVLDLCGAPGGKATHLSSLIGQNGFLVANEAIRQRAFLLAQNLTKWGLSNAIVTHSDPSAFSRIPGFFDIIVVDAPCSGEGMFRDQVAINEWSVENTLLCAERQKRILMDVWPALKTGGILIYSTCTFNPSENEENIKWLLERHDAESLQLDISRFSGITEISFSGVKGYGFHPGRIRGEGLFFSVVRKTGSNGSLTIKPRKTGIPVPSREEMKTIHEWTDFRTERIIRRGEETLALPCEAEEFRTLSEALKIITPGTLILTSKNEKLIPSHELALSVRLKKNSFPAVEADLQNALSFLRRDNLKMKFEKRAWNLVTYKGVNLGFVNNLVHRSNNYFPVEWRIRMSIPESASEKIIKWNLQ